MLPCPSHSLRAFLQAGWPLVIMSQGHQATLVNIGSLTKTIFERRMSSFTFLDIVFAQSCGLIVFIRVKKLSNSSLVASRPIKREKTSFPFYVRHSKTFLLKLPCKYYIMTRFREIWWYLSFSAISWTKYSTYTTQSHSKELIHFYKSGRDTENHRKIFIVKFYWSVCQIHASVIYSSRSRNPSLCLHTIFVDQ